MFLNGNRQKIMKPLNFNTFISNLKINEYDYLNVV